jgi:hypothetical protein
MAQARPTPRPLNYSSLSEKTTVFTREKTVSSEVLLGGTSLKQRRNSESTRNACINGLLMKIKFRRAANKSAVAGQHLDPTLRRNCLKNLKQRPQSKALVVLYLINPAGARTSLDADFKFSPGWFKSHNNNNNNTQKAAIATLPLTTHPQWAEMYTELRPHQI